LNASPETDEGGIGLAMRIKIDRNISVPAYQQVADHIKSQILGGKLAAGGRVPPEYEIMD
jgi:DNA-binding GntR family transcriptional regulator